MSNDELNFEEPIVEAAMEQEEQMAADPHTLLDESVVESEGDTIVTEKEEDFIVVDNLSVEEEVISEEGAWEVGSAGSESLFGSLASNDFVIMEQQGVGDPNDGIGGGGPVGTPPGTYNKDIIITPGRLNTNGTNADRYSQIDIKFAADDAYLGVIRSSDKKASIYNFAEAYTISATSYDFPILAIGGSWNAGAGDSTYAPSTTWGGSTGLSLISIDSQIGRGSGLALRPAISQIEAALYNNIGLYTSSSATQIVITSYSNSSIIPGATPTAVRSLTINTGNITISGNSGGGRTLNLTSNSKDGVVKGK